MADIHVETTAIRKQRVAVSPPLRSHTSRRRRECEETLVRDARADLRPAELVENKLRGVLKYTLVPLSQIRMSVCCGARNHR